MAIRLANNCINCDNFVDGGVCAEHKVMVSAKHTCDSFEMKPSLKNDRNCITCSRYETESCAHPEHASPGMLCASWAPRAEA